MSRKMPRSRLTIKAAPITAALREADDVVMVDGDVSGPDSNGRTGGLDRG